jgi:Ca2+-binding RTX toxin-like protein
LVGSGLSVQTGPFAITAGTITGFQYNEGYMRAGLSREAAGISVDGATFWNLASTGQWHAIWVLATANNDTMTGSNVATNPDFIEGGGANDIIYGRAGDDSIWGNAGRDFLYGGDGNDIVVCNDWQTPSDTNLWAEGHGDAGDDYIFTGNYGHGYLNGGAGSDRIWGGPDSDFLTGGAGIDYLAGGAGGDVFEFAAATALSGEYDFIVDFQDGVDSIKLQAGTSWYVADSAYGAIIGSLSSSFYVIVQYATAAMVSDQIYYA